MKKDFANNLVQKTRDDYNKIARHFASTRKYNWPNLKKLLKNTKADKNFRVGDLGCGNGRIFEIIGKDIDYYGLDLSDELISIAKEKYPSEKFITGDILKTPYDSDFFDLTLSVATLHHIPGNEKRQQALKEIFRVTKPGGKIIITNWYFWDNPRYLKLMLREAFRKIFKKSDLDFGDFYMPWKSPNKSILAERYFHAWRKIEIIHELKRAGFINIKILPRKDNGRLDPNIIAIAIKPDE